MATISFELVHSTFPVERIVSFIFYLSFLFGMFLNEIFSNIENDRLKTNMEAAEERGHELQRLLDASRAAESQSKCLLRSLQQQKQQQLVDRPIEDPIKEKPVKVRDQDVVTVCRLVDDLAEVEERLHLMETDWMDEKRKRVVLETEMVALQQENQRLLQHQQLLQQSITTNYSVANNPESLTPVASLSLSEELLISSSTSDFTSAQWRDAWDNSGPLSLIGSGRKQCSEDEELSSDSSSSGFSEENRSVQQKATQTDPFDLSTNPIESDVKSLFREIFAVIQQNI